MNEIRTFSYKNKTFLFEPDTLRFQSQGMTGSGMKVDWGEGAIEKNQPVPMKGINFITLNVAHDCNMACPYCFAKQGHYNGPRAMMTTETACAAVDWLLRVSGERTECYLRFLGGEPLLNISVMRETMQYAERMGNAIGKKVYFSVNTNGTICTPEVIELLGVHNVTTSISMDGTREAHNRFRIFNSGRGTYDLVVKNLEKFLQNDPYTFVNATLTAENLDIYEYAMHFRDLGIRLMRFAMVGTSIPEIAINQAAKLEQIIDNYDRLANRYQEDLAAGDIWYLADFYKYFEHLRTLHKRMNRCSAGTSYVNVDLKGDVHLCHRFTADVTQKIGHISGDSPNVPESITRRDQLAPVLKSVPSGPGKSRSLPVLKAGGNQTPIFVHHRLDGQRLLQQEHSQAGAVNVCSICDIRYLCGGACFHDGEILFGDLHGGPDGFKCEVDRHLAKIGIFLLDSINKLDATVLPALDELHHHSIQHTD